MNLSLREARVLAAALTLYTAGRADPANMAPHHRALREIGGLEPDEDLPDASVMELIVRLRQVGLD